MVVLTAEPTANISGQISKWNAAFNPVKFTFQREANDDRDNLRLEVVITSGSKTITGFFSPGPDGKIIANLYRYLKSLIRPVDAFKHDKPSYIDRNLFAPYTVKYREEWEDNNRATQNSVWVTLPSTYYITYSAMQLGERFGGNMAEYVTFTGGTVLAKFLTEFQEPRAWQGLPYDVAFILSEKLLFKQVFFRYTPIDVNGTEIEDGILLYYLLTEEGGKFLNEEADGGILLEISEVPPLIDSTILPENTLPQDVGLVRLRLPNVVDTAAQIKLDVFYVEGDQTIQITEEKYVAVTQHCESDPYVYLKWMNHLGAWDYYRFGFNQTRFADVSNSQLISRVVSDWENDDTIQDVISKSAFNKIVVGANNLTPDAMHGLSWLKKGIKAQMLTSINPVKWQTVIVQPGATDPIESRFRSGNIKLTISLPEVNIQNQ